jgi:hypothetical protein
MTAFLMSVLDVFDSPPLVDLGIALAQKAAVLLTDCAGGASGNPSVKPLTGVRYRPLDGGSTASGAGRRACLANRCGADSLAAAA